MSEYLQLHEELKSAISQTNETRENQLTSLGDILTSVKKLSILDPAFVEAITNAKNLRKTLREKESTVTRWYAIEKELSEAKSAFKELDESRGGLRTELEGYFEDIGTAAFKLFRKSPSIFANSAGILDDMQEFEMRRKEKEKELHQLESGPDSNSFLGKTFRKGKGMVLRGSLKSRELQRGKRMRIIGQHLCELDTMPDIPEGSDLAVLLGPLSASINSYRKEHGELERITERRSALEQERVAIEKGARMRNPVRNLEHQASQIQHNLQSQYNVIGHLFEEFSTDEDRTSGKVAKILSQIDNNEKEIKKLEKLLGRVEAAVEVDELEKKKLVIGAEQEKLRRRIGELDSEQDKLATEIVKTTKLRGNVASLKLPGSPTAADSPTDAAE
ncbi:MAG: hypothetical protein HN368_04225 [Spirochaetales bacterium]|jgi:Asp-tRNA(Asn)/Glu-tRNA(Gln) amidotransferase C subunit|nr:hypothetical protein [Spirochaetales bacterium]